MKKIRKRIFFFIGFALSSILPFFMFLEIQHENRKIKSHETTTAIIADVVELNKGNSTYLVVKEGENQESILAQSKSSWNVYTYGERVTLSMQPNVIIVDDTLLSTDLGILIAVSSMPLAFLSLLLYFRDSIFVRFCGALLMIGITIVVVTLTHYSYEERKIFTTHSENVQGTLIDYTQKTCTKSVGNRNRQEKYQCYAMVIEYQPQNSSETLKFEGSTRYKNQDISLGSKIRVAYLSSNPKVARQYKRMIKSNFIYIGSILSVICIGLSLLMLRAMFYPINQQRH